MKRLFTVFATVLLYVGAFAASPADEINWIKVEASDLNLCGKAFDTPNPYHRIDTCVYKGFTKRENELCRSSAGLTVLFRTDARHIAADLEFGDYVNTSAYCSYRGLDLYIRKDGKWLWAGSCTFSPQHIPGDVKYLVKDMDEGMKECLLYLPLECEPRSCRVCVPEGSSIEPMPSPFRHRIVFHGSSFTQGISCTRAGMSYPMQFMRRTGLQVIPLGFSGRCKMQPYFLDLLEDVEADAYVFDPFSNSGVNNIRARLEPFIDGMVKAHPGKPVIVQRTIYREKENFDTALHTEQQSRRDLSDSLMTVLCRKYKDVYYIKPDAALHNGESSTADGTHPNDNGYSLWEASIEKPILRILRKYGIR